MGRIFFPPVCNTVRHSVYSMYRTCGMYSRPVEHVQIARQYRMDRSYSACGIYNMYLCMYICRYYQIFKYTYHINEYSKFSTPKIASSTVLNVFIVSISNNTEHWINCIHAPLLKQKILNIVHTRQIDGFPHSCKSLWPY